jgi:hypothetical protein
MAPPELKGLFSAQETLPSEMARLGRLRREEPEVATSIMQLNEQLVHFARTGNLLRLNTMITTVPRVRGLAVFLVHSRCR